MTEQGAGLAVEANQFLIVDGREGILLDPGGPKIYPNVAIDTRDVLHAGRLRYVFLSHQDPDICTSLNSWLIDTDADVYISKLWRRFVPHFGIDHLLETRLKPIPDEGQRLPLGNSELIILPAHFLHSCGNFQVFDPISKILFSGDLGASIGSDETIVSDFDAHVELMRGFHRRYMTSQSVLRLWVRMVRQLDIEMIAPQHGAMIKGRPMVARFLEWCENEPCGTDLMGDVFRVPG